MRTIVHTFVFFFSVLFCFVCLFLYKRKLVDQRDFSKVEQVMKCEMMEMLEMLEMLEILETRIDLGSY